MRTVTPAYAAKLARLVKMPAYAVRFFHIDRLAAEAEYEFSVDFVTHATPGLLKPSLQALAAPQGNTATVQPEEGRSSIGVFALPLVDLGDEIGRYLADPMDTLAVTLSAGGGETTVQVTEDIAGYPSRGTLLIDTERIKYTARNPATKLFSGLTRAANGTALTAHAIGAVVHNGEQIRAGQRVQLYAGYQDADFADWLAFAKMEVSSVAMTSAVQYVVSCADIQRMTTKVIFLSSTQEAPTVFAGNPIELLLEWLISDGSASTSTGTVQATAPNILRGVGTKFKLANFLLPGDWLAFGFGDADDKQYARVQELVSDELLVTSTPVRATKAGLSYRRAGSSSKYNVLAAYDGVAMPLSLIDVAGLEALRDSDFAAQKYLYRINAPTEAKASLEAHVKSLNCYPAVNGAGQWGLKRYKATAQTAVALAALDEMNIVSWAWSGSEDSIINIAEFSYDWNIGTGGAPNDYQKRQRYRALDSINKYGARGIFKISAAGLRTVYGAQAILDDRAFKLFTRYADPPAQLHVFTFYGKQAVEVGDVVSVTHARIPNRRTGRRGLVAELFEVRDLRPLFGAGGGMDLTLLHVGGLTVQAVPFSDGTENNLKTLVVSRVAFQNAASVAMVLGVEVETARLSITLQRSTDAVLIQGRSFMDSALGGSADFILSRIRATDINGTLIDGVAPPTFLEGVGGKTALLRGSGVVAHDTLYAPGVAGSLTIVMTGSLSAGGVSGTVRDRELALTLRSR